MKSNSKKLLKKHDKLTHSDNMRVVSHVQRESGEWIINTLMIDNCDIPFKYKRKARYQSLKGARVNLTYYADTQQIAGIAMEVMTVVRIKVA
jgi:hypothetical protein